MTGQFRTEQGDTAVVPFALVRTRRAWPGGVHRAEVTRVEGAVATVAGRTYPLSELEVIRPPVPRRPGRDPAAPRTAAARARADRFAAARGRA